MTRRRAWALVVALACASVAAAAVARYYPAYRSALAARADLQQAQTLLREQRLNATEANLAAAEAQLRDAEDGFRQARSVLRDPLMRTARRLPLLGPAIDATVDLVDIGIEGAHIGYRAVEVTRTYQSIRYQGAGTLTERSQEILERVEPPMTVIGERLASIRQRRSEVAGVALPRPLVTAVREMDDDVAELEELVETYRDLSFFLPEFLGFNGPRTYLLLAQNNAELLPTGGLISVYGLITLRDGRIEEQLFEDAVAYGARWLERTDAYVEPPAPLRHYLLRDFSWSFALSNWSPHFPTAAQEAERFFRLAGGRPVDGVIAFNVHTIEELLRVTGPIAVEEYGVTVTAENALDVIEEHTRTAQEPETDRKAFVGALADELLPKLMHAPPEQWTPLVETLQRLRDERQILLFHHQPAVQTLAGRLELDGGLAPVDGDSFMLVDASVNSTKLNIALEQQVELTVRLDPLGGAAHEATIRYYNNLPTWEQGRDPELVQRLMLGGLYGGYVRLLAPLASRPEGVLLDGREAGLEELSHEQGKTVFGRFFALPRGERRGLTFRYSTPGVAHREGEETEYRLYLQKQSGTGAIPLHLRIALPEGAQLVSAELDGEAVESLSAIETDLSRDRGLIVRYKLNPQQ